MIGAPRRAMPALLVLLAGLQLAAAAQPADQPGAGPQATHEVGRAPGGDTRRKL